MPYQSRRRPTKRLKSFLRALAIVVSIPAILFVVVLLIAYVTFNPNAYKRQIIAAVQAATGRELTVRGPIHMGFGLSPSIVATDISLADGGATATGPIVSLRRLELDVSLLGLLFGDAEIGELTLSGVDVRLRGDLGGEDLLRAGQEEHTAASAAAARDQPSDGVTEGSHVTVALRALRVRDLRVGWQAQRSGLAGSWHVPRIDAEAEEIGGSMLLSGSIDSGGRSLRMIGELGGLGRLLDPSASQSWPFDVTADGDGVRLTMRGSLSHPVHHVGYTLQVDGSVTDWLTIAPLMPMSEPALHDGSFTMSLSNEAPRSPILTSLVLHANGVVMPLSLPGVEITRVDMVASAPDQPVRLVLRLNVNGLPAQILVTVGSMAAFIPGFTPNTPTKVDVNADVGGALASVKGTIRAPLALKGLDLVVFARVPLLTTLAPLVKLDLPDWRKLGIEATIDGDAVAGGTLSMHRIVATLPAGEVNGDLVLRLLARPALRGALSARQLDLDRLIATLATSGSLFSATPPAPEAPRLRPLGAAAAEKQPTVFSNRPFDLGWMDRADADLRMAIAQLQAGDITYGNLKARLQLSQGRLILDQVSGEAPGGKLEAALAIDSRASPSPMTLNFIAPTFPVRTLAAALGAPDALSGAASVAIDLRGAGRSPHEMAASLNGGVSVAMVGGGSLDAPLGDLLGSVLRSAKLPVGLLSVGTRAQVQCLAARLDLSLGQGSIATLFADTSRIQISGSGSVDFDNELMDVRLRPVLRAGPGITVPLRIGGSFLKPRPELDATFTSKTGILGGLTGAPEKAGDKGSNKPGDKPAAKSPDQCAAALAIARAPVMAANAAAAPAAPRPVPDPGILRPGGGGKSPPSPEIPGPSAD